MVPGYVASFCHEVAQFALASTAGAHLEPQLQEPILWSGSVAENLDPGGDIAEEKLREALQKALAAVDVESFLHGSRK